MKKQITVLLITAFIISMAFSGCTKKIVQDLPQTYVQGILDTLYLGQYNEEFLAITAPNSTDQLMQEYENGINTEVDYFAYYFNLPTLSSKSRLVLIDMYKDIYIYSKYQVKPSVNQGNVYSIDIVVSPIDIIYNVVQEYIAGYIEDMNNSQESGEFKDLTEEEYNEMYVLGIVEIVQNNIENLGYLADQTVTVRVGIDQEDGLYYIKDDDLAKIDECVIKY